MSESVVRDEIVRGPRSYRAFIFGLLLIEIGRQWRVLIKGVI